ncbi:MAG: hypothetical protein IT379_04405 [Deltaproteobacteria bacterium]|nr:hypothetical protein [Deltaproteobacteria bacterium]
MRIGSFIAVAWLAGAVCGCGGRAAVVTPRVPTFVIGDPSRRPLPDTLAVALSGWSTAASDPVKRRMSWGASDEPGAAELRGLALGHDARAGIARFALRAMQVAHRAIRAPQDTVALEALLDAGGTRVPGDPGFAAFASVLSLELAAEALERGDPGTEDAWWLDELAQSIESQIARTRAIADAAVTQVPVPAGLDVRARAAALRWLSARGVGVDQGPSSNATSTSIARPSSD